ncbi:MAG: thiamine phosphate synthase [Bacilli bacterium]
MNSILKLYFIAGTQDIAKNSTLPQTLQEALKFGITCFQFREKGLHSLQNKDEVKEMAKVCLALCQSAKVPFIINDDVELALEIGADGVHIGQSDRNIYETIQMVNGRLFIGLSVNSFEQFMEAETIKDLDYIGVGPVYSTTSKADAQEAVGLELLEKVVIQQSKLPIVAIGGISERNVHLVRSTGVTGICVISAITKSKNIETTIENLIKK